MLSTEHTPEPRDHTPESSMEHTPETSMESMESMEPMEPMEPSSKTLCIVKEQNSMVFKDGLGLSRNQTRSIKDILLQKDEFRSLMFLDIKPLLNDNYYLKISKRSSVALIKQYELVFEFLSQNVGKAIAKEWIKTICPRKQALYPYRYNEIPDWWPKSVPHVEPDHLDKSGRIQLLIGIIRHESVDLTKLKGALNNLDFSCKNKKNSKVLEYKYAFNIIYELFYMSLYERLFMNYGNTANLDLINDLTPSEMAILRDGLHVYIKVSRIKKDDCIRFVKENQVNSTCFPVTLSPEEEPSIKPLEVKEPEKDKDEQPEQDEAYLIKLEQEDGDFLGDGLSWHSEEEPEEEEPEEESRGRKDKHTNNGAIAKPKGRHSNSLASKLALVRGRVLFEDDLEDTLFEDIDGTTGLGAFQFNSGTLNINGGSVSIKYSKPIASSSPLDVTKSQSTPPQITRTHSVPTLDPMDVSSTSSSSSSSNSTGFSTPVPTYEYTETWLKSPVSLTNSPGVMLVTSPMYEYDHIYEY